MRLSGGAVAARKTDSCSSQLSRPLTARCPDGITEAIESQQEGWLAIGTQFHPEHDSASALDLRIFEEFIDGVKERHPEELRMVA